MKRIHTLKTAGVSLCAVLAVAVVVLNAHIAAVIPIGFDEAFNLQVAKSLATHFAYKSTYAPAVVYNPDVTTNGPIQYFAALVYLLSRNVDITIVIVTTVAMALFMSAVFMVRPWIVALLAAIYPFWSTFVYAATGFLGEIWATSATLFGILALEHALARSDTRTVVRDPLFTIGCICLGIAVSTKLLLAAAVAPFLFCLFIEQGKAVLPLQARLIAAVLITARALCIISLFFFLQFSFSVGHTVGAWFHRETFSTLTAFLHGHLSQAYGSMRQSPGTADSHEFSNHAVLIVIMMCAVSLVSSRPSFAIFISTLLALAFIADMDERRMLPMYLMVLSFGAREIIPCMRVLGARGRLQVVAAPAIVILGFLFLNALVGHGFKQKFYGDANRSLALGGSYKGYHFHRQLIDTLDRQRYVLTSGWWQFPEITLRYNLHFYDRMASQNAAIPASRTVLFFNTAMASLWPPTTIRGNCSSIVYREGPLVICRPRSDVPVSYLPATLTLR